MHVCIKSWPGIQKEFRMSAAWNARGISHLSTLVVLQAKMIHMNKDDIVADQHTCRAISTSSGGFVRLEGSMKRPSLATTSASRPGDCEMNLCLLIMYVKCVGVCALCVRVRENCRTIACKTCESYTPSSPRLSFPTSTSLKLQPSDLSDPSSNPAHRTFLALVFTSYSALLHLCWLRCLQSAVTRDSMYLRSGGPASLDMSKSTAPSPLNLYKMPFHSFSFCPILRS